MKSHATEKKSLITFGAERPKIVKTPKVSLKIKLKDEHYLSIDANVVPTITGTVWRNRFPKTFKIDVKPCGKIYI